MNDDLLSKEPKIEKSDAKAGTSLASVSIFVRMITGLGNLLSLPRVIGHLLGNSRDLERIISERDLLIAQKDAETAWLREQVKFWSERCLEFQDSVLLSKGMRQTRPVAPQNGREIGSTVPGPSQRMAIDTEVDKLKEMLIYRPSEVNERLSDLEAVNTPFTKEVVRQFYAYVESVSADSAGIVIT